MLTLLVATAISAAASTSALADPSLPSPASSAHPDAFAALASSPGGSSSSTVILPALALLGLAGAAVVLARRKSRQTRFIQVLETASLGPKRSLVVAQMLGETLLLGVSEAGISVLSTRASSPEMLAAGDAKSAGVDAAFEADLPTASPQPVVPLTRVVPASRAAPSLGGLAALFGKSLGPAPVQPSFDSYLVESAEDLDLRRKLAAGQRASVK